MHKEQQPEPQSGAFAVSTQSSSISHELSRISHLTRPCDGTEGWDHAMNLVVQARFMTGCQPTRGRRRRAVPLQASTGQDRPAGHELGLFCLRPACHAQARRVRAPACFSWARRRFTWPCHPPLTRCSAAPRGRRGALPASPTRDDATADRRFCPENAVSDAVRNPKLGPIARGCYNVPRFAGRVWRGLPV